ncbi:MAG: hypothetical protein E7331_07980 [Clostridiales bacterium]|nr:hypothetical protein [Clostridiales bacterium]
MKNTKKWLAALLASVLLFSAAGATAEIRQGDVISFGRYMQEMPDQDIQWRVLYVHGDTAVLLSDRILECMPFDQEDNRWVGSDLCIWLNGWFLNSSFGYEERWRILPDESGLYVRIPTRGDMTNPAYGFSANPDAKDDRRIAAGSPTAINNGLWTSKLGNSTYYLRSTPNSTNLDQVRVTGSIGIARIDRDNVGVRPMITIYIGGMDPLE